MKVSKIGWTDFSGGDLNFVTGCTPVSEGCQNCYARAIYKRFGRDFETVKTHEDKLERLWRTGFPEWSPKRGAGHRPMAFVCDTGDLFHPDVPEDFLEFVFHTMGHLSGVAWQVLTKRPERMRAFMQRFNFEDLPSDHIWLGVTAENQQRADERIPILLDTPASVRFVSCEPMLERIDIRRYLGYTDDLGHSAWTPTPTAGRANKRLREQAAASECATRRQGSLHLVICGAESGGNRRKFDVAWAVDLYEQCKDAGVAYFYKQGSALQPGQHDELPGLGVVHEWPTERR